MTDHELITKYVDTLLDEGKRKHGEVAYAYALGNLEAKLDNIMFKLKIGMAPAEIYAQLVDSMKERIK